MTDVEIVRVGDKNNRLLAPEETVIDKQFESVVKIRPQNFQSYIGQDLVKENLQIYVSASIKLKKQLDHIILHGPPGLGKTTLAKIVAQKLGRPLYETRGPAIDHPGSLAGILMGLVPGSVLFIDEIHRMSIRVEEILYSAMEDFQLDFLSGSGAAARPMQVELPPFTLIGATTRLALLSKPLRDRFGIQERVDFYGVESLTQIILRSAKIQNMDVELSGAKEIAFRARGTPRLANRLLRRVWDFCVSKDLYLIDKDVADDVLNRQGIDRAGLDRIDRQILQIIFEQYSGGPVGIEAISATLNEDRSTIEEVYEPFLVHKGYLGRSPRGRMLTPKGQAHLEKKQAPNRNP